MLWVTIAFFTSAFGIPEHNFTHVVAMTIEGMGDLHLRCLLSSGSNDAERTDRSLLGLFVLSLETPRPLRSWDLDSWDLSLSRPRRSPPLSLDPAREELPWIDLSGSAL